MTSPIKTFTITTAASHGLQPGSQVSVQIEGGKIARLWWLLKRPRITVVKECTATTATLVEARMTWAQWRGAIFTTIFR